MASKRTIQPLKRKVERPISAAFDIGTTYSGYAYSTNKDIRRVVTNQTWISGGRPLVSLKAPTCVLLTPSKQFHSFGYEAEDFYASLAEEDQHHEWYYFSRFKMMLLRDKDLTHETTIDDIQGKSMPALEIFSHTIKFLKDHLLGLLNKQIQNATLSDVSFSLTVPAIWNEKAKMFMRNAAIKAGIPSDQLFITLEPEAASVWCQGLDTKLSSATEGSNLDTSAPGIKYMLIDVGGGTADITIHEKLAGGKLKEIHKASGGPWGGIEADKGFLSFLTDIVSEPVMKRFKVEQMSDFMDILRDFELKKRNISLKNESKVVVRIPSSLKSMFQEAGHSVEELKNRFGDQIRWEGDKMKFAADVIKGIISTPISSLIAHVRQLLSDEKLGDLQQIFLVGGFAESKLLQESFEKTFEGKQINVPADCGLAVLKGAVVFGHNPMVMTVRVARYTYGIDMCVPFDPQIHPKEKLIVTGSGKFCDNGFWKAVEIGEEIPVGYTVSRVGKPVYNYQSHVVFDIYKSTKKDPIVTTDESCERLGSIQLEVDSTKKIDDNKYDQIFYFGDTEIKFFTKIHQTGEITRRYLDF